MILMADVFAEIPAPKNMVDKCPKSRVSEDPWTENAEMDRKTVAIWMTAALKYLLIIVNVVAMEEVSFSDTKNSKAVC